MPRPGLVVVICGPSGVGKGTVIQGLLAADAAMTVSVSATTRPPRPGEVDGESYFFLTRQAFEADIAHGRFLEWATYNDHLYGTPRQPLVDAVAAGKVVLLDIEVQGAAQIRDHTDADLEPLFLFLAPPDWSTLASRLRNRGTESPEAVASRLARARAEMDERHWFHHEVVNDDLAQTIAEVRALITQTRTARGQSPE